MSATLTLERLRRGGEGLMQELSREYYQAHAGLKAGAELQPIYEKYRSVLGRDALDLTLDLFRSAPAGSEEARQARQLLEWQVESQAARLLAPHDEREIAWEASAVVRVDDG